MKGPMQLTTPIIKHDIDISDLRSSELNSLKAKLNSPIVLRWELGLDLNKTGVVAIQLFIPSQSLEIAVIYDNAEGVEVQGNIKLPMERVEIVRRSMHNSIIPKFIERLNGNWKVVF
jgi:hypothetical protein